MAVFSNDGGTDPCVVAFYVMPLFPDCPNTIQMQQFRYSANISSPFGIPAWGSEMTSGTWAFIVLTNLGDIAYTLFTVVP